MALKSASRSFPGFETFYLIGSYGSTRAFRGNMEVGVDQADAFTRGELTPKQPAIIRYYMGGGPKDVVWTTFIAPLIVHNRIIELLVGKGFSGWATYPVIIYGKKGEVYEDYSGLAFKGRCGPIDDSRSEIVQRNYPGGKFPVLKGLFFNPESWDGCDFFMSLDGGGHKFVTQAVKNCFDQAKVAYLDLDRLTDVEQPTGWKVST